MISNPYNDNSVAFNSLFNNCSGIFDITQLDIKTVDIGYDVYVGCCSYMFANCPNITQIPKVIEDLSNSITDGRI
jgi:hypothetical protein